MAMMNEMEYRTIGSALAGGYRAAVYCRLSKDDDLQGESASIANQRDMLEKYCEKQGWEVVAVYLRKMAIDGYVVKLDLPELRELVSLLRYSSNNLNQLTRRAHETGRIYETDLEDIQQNQERIWTAAEKIVSSLAALK